MTEHIKNPYPLYINGAMQKAEDNRVFSTVNPSTGEDIASVSNASLKDMRLAIAAAREAFDSGVWSDLSMAERGIYLKALAKEVRAYAKELAELECADVGKTMKQATFIDVPTAAETFEYFGGLSEALDPKVNPVAAPVRSETVYEPMGVVGLIIPWNYPLIMAAWKMAPALIAGNTIVFKPSPLGCLSIMRLAQLAKSIGFPDGVFNVVATQDLEPAEELVRHADVDMVSFTGGTSTGESVMRCASTTTKKLTLELGGKSPNIVFPDCDFEAALGGTLSSIFMNQGQMCTAASRLYVHEDIYDRFVGALVQRARTLKIGPADQPDTEFGPLISLSQRDHLIKAIAQAKAEGADVLCGGQIPQGREDDRGFYFEPTIISGAAQESAIMQEELFGPVLCVSSFSDEGDVIRRANDSVYGLAACVWTKDDNLARTLSRQLQCGTVWINTYGGFYNEAPFGGFKRSGFGRELGTEGLKEFTQAKHVCSDTTPGGKPLVASWF